MKKLLYIFLAVSLVFSACEEEVEEVRPCLCENSGNSILIKEVNIEEFKDKNDNINFANLINELEKEEGIECYPISSIPLLVSEKTAFISGNEIVCDNSPSEAEVEVSFSNGIAPYTYIYAINGINQGSTTTDDNPDYIKTKQEGVYTLIYFSDAINIGATNGSAIVTVLESPTATFSTDEDTMSVLNTTLKLQDNSLGNIVSWHWNFGDGTDSYDQNPYHSYDAQLGIYQISLIVTDNMGCSDTTSKTIWISDDYWVYIPNAFTPDYDGVNDLFCLTYHGIQEATFYFNIYDRFSNLVYATENITDLECFSGGSQANGWDGKHQITGNNLPSGVYIYEMYYKDFEGWEHQKNGKISIIDKSNVSNDFECYPQGFSNCKFGDMIDPQHGFIYQTQENINNWY